MHLKQAGFLLCLSLVFPAGAAYPAALPKHYHESGGYATGIEAGMGGKVIKVTNLNSGGPGSLKAALGTSGPRLIVFEVGGVIEGSHSISKGEVTVAGQTAPYPGITLVKGTLSIGGSNIVVSHIAVRVGDAKGASDGIVITGKNVVLDHVISSWGVDETLTLKGGDNITLYKCIIAESLSDSKHPEGEHSKGNLIFMVCDPVSIIGCLYAHNRMRNPRVNDSKVAIVNNVVYDPAPGYDIGPDKPGLVIKDTDPVYHYFVHLGDWGRYDFYPQVSFVGNVGMHGPDTDAKARWFLHGHINDKGEAYMKDNIIVDRQGSPLAVAHEESIIPLDAPPLWPVGLEAAPAHESLYEALRTVGPHPGQREAVTKRIVKSVADGNGGIIDSQNDVGGYPNYTETKRPLNVPDNQAARRNWLDSLESGIAVDKDIDLSRLYGLVGSQASDKLAPGYVNRAGPVSSGSGFCIIRGLSGAKRIRASFSLPAANVVGMTVFDMAGKVAVNLPGILLPAGEHEMDMDVEPLPAGHYLIRLRIGDTAIIRPIPLVF